MIGTKIGRVSMAMPIQSRNNPRTTRIPIINRMMTMGAASIPRIDWETKRLPPIRL